MESTSTLMAMENTSTYIPEWIVPAFMWLVFAIILGAFLAWAFRTAKVLFDDKRLERAQTLGLPKGTIRSFIVITFTAIMFIVFFADYPGLNIPAEDTKWFLAAYGSIVAFYFGAKYFPERFGQRGLAIYEVDPPTVKRPASGTEQLMLTIRGTGFESPEAAGVDHPDGKLSTSTPNAESGERLTAKVTLAHDSPEGAYDVWIRLANGSKIVRTAALTVVDS